MNFIDNLRKENGYTYSHLSQILNCSKSYVWQLFNKKRNLSYEQAILIASIFNMKPDEIFYSDLINYNLKEQIKNIKKIKEEIDKKISIENNKK